MTAGQGARVAAAVFLLAGVLLSAAPFVLAQSLHVWSGATDLQSGTSLDTSVSPAGELVLASHPANWTAYAGNPVVTPSQAWDADWTMAPDILFENGVYKMWYVGCNPTCSVGYATSADATSWTPYSGNPVLPANATSWDSGVLTPRVIHDGSQYKMWYGADGPLGFRIGYAVSADGIHWTKYGTWPVFNGTMSWDGGSVETPAVVKLGSTFVMYFSGSASGVFSIGRATASDGVNWTEYTGNPVMVSQGGWEGDRIHPGWFSVGASGYDLYYNSGSPGATPQIGHAKSPDGLTWTRDAVNPVLAPGAAGTWDAWAVAHPFLVTVGSELRMYFTGYDSSSNSVLQIGYATLPLSGTSYVFGGTWASSIFDSGSPNTTWMSLSWTAMVPTNTSLTAFLAVGNSSTPDFSWTSSPPSTATPDPLHLPKSQYAQVIVALVSLDGVRTPSLSSVSVTYEMPNPPDRSFGGLGLAGFVLLLVLLAGGVGAIAVTLLVASRVHRGPGSRQVPHGSVLCPRCGTVSPATSRFCSNCGDSLSPPGGPPPPGA